MLRPRSAGLSVCPRVAVTIPDRPSDRARVGHDPVIRRSGQVVQDRLLWSVRWADIPQLSIPGQALSSGLAAVLAAGASERLRYSTICFQAGHIHVLRGSWECPRAAADRGCLLLVAAVAVTVAVSSAEVLRR